MNNHICKAKSRSTGEWVQGYYVQKTDPLLNFPYHFILNQECDNGSSLLSSFMTWHQVDPDTVCRYTGLNDQKCNPIFENDMIKFCRYYEYWDADNEILLDKVIFEDGCFCLEHTYSCDGYNELSCIYNEISFSGEYDSDCIFEVIGNKFDNTELMEGE